VKKSLEELALPANVMALMEQFPARPPAFPNAADIDSRSDTRIMPGGPSSSEILRTRDDSLRDDVLSVVQETVRVRQKSNAATVLLQGLTPIQAAVSSAITQINNVPASGVGGVVDFFAPGSALLGTSDCAYEPIWGQATLPYANNPQSQILRPAYGARPGTIVRYARIPRVALNSTYTGTFVYDETDPEAFFGVDGRFDTAWTVPVGSTEDLLVSVLLPPTLGNTSRVNAIGVVPWPLYGATIVEAWVRNGGDDSTTIPGWTPVSLAGQVNYNSGSDSIVSAGAHRLFFASSPVREVLVRLRPQTETHLGLIQLDCWAIEFKPAGTIVLDGAEVGVENISRASLAGLNPSSLSRLPVSLNGTEVTIDLSSASPYDSPVLTSVAFEPVPAGGDDTGFDYDVFSP
jgi:hypothetical protein